MQELQGLYLWQTLDLVQFRDVRSFQLAGFAALAKQERVMLAWLILMLTIVPVDHWVQVPDKNIRVGIEYFIGQDGASVDTEDAMFVPINDTVMQTVLTTSKKVGNQEAFRAICEKLHAQGKLYRVDLGTKVKVLQIKPHTYTVDFVFTSGKNKGKKGVLPITCLCTKGEGVAVASGGKIWMPVDVDSIAVGREYTIGAPYHDAKIKENVPIPINEKQLKRLQDTYDSKLPEDKIRDWVNYQSLGGNLYPIALGTKVKVLKVNSKTESVDIVFLDGKYKGGKGVVPFLALCTQE